MSACNRLGLDTLECRPNCPKISQDIDLSGTFGLFGWIQKLLLEGRVATVVFVMDDLHFLLYGESEEPLALLKHLIQQLHIHSMVDDIEEPNINARLHTFTHVLHFNTFLLRLSSTRTLRFTT